MTFFTLNYLTTKDCSLHKITYMLVSSNVTEKLQFPAYNILQENLVLEVFIHIVCLFGEI
jgi:hypothetical protein